MSSTLRILATLLATTALLAAPACSTSGDDDGDDTVDSSPGGTIDAAGGGGTPDAAGGGGTPDAAGGGGDLLGLGQLCPTGAECVTGAATQCIKLATAGTQFCTLPCGSNDTPDTAPADGNGICAAAYNGTTPTQGTPMCSVRDSNTAPVNWSCGINCGMAGSTDLGGCPDGLVCTANFCQ